MPRGQLSWMLIGTSLVIPIIYGAWMMVHGWLAGWYPYPLFNPARVGHQSAYRNLVAFLGMFIVVMVVLYIVDRVLGSLRRELNRA